MLPRSLGSSSVRSTTTTTTATTTTSAIITTPSTQPPATTTTTTTTTTMPTSTTTTPTTSSPKHPKSQQQDQAQDQPVYFWRPTEANSYLGQWYPSPFTVDGETYATAEMWMMVQKARLFSDEKVAKQMLGTTDPKVHKKVRGFEGGVWDERTFPISIIIFSSEFHLFG